MRLLDLFCGAGGAAMGYSRAGFTEIIGVDIKPQPRYPFTFVLGDALDYVRAHGREFDAIHASPPCQGYSIMRNLPWLRDKEYPLLIAPTAEALGETGVPWVIENVMGAKLASGWLCGSMFGLPFFRHRFFWAGGWFWLQPPHAVHQTRILSWFKQNGARRVGVAVGHAAGIGLAREQMDLAWMTREELTQAIPPAYTYFVGCQLMVALGHEPRIWPPRDMPMSNLPPSERVAVLAQGLSPQGGKSQPLRAALEDEGAPSAWHPETGTA